MPRLLCYLLKDSFFEFLPSFFFSKNWLQRFKSKLLNENILVLDDMRPFGKICFVKSKI